MAEAFIVRRGGGGGSGGALVVTSSGAGTVTVSNSALGKSYSKSVTAGGSVTFKGLKTGTWTVQLSNGTQTSTKTITITSDYSTSIAYFSATINITYPANSNCVVTNSGGQTVASDTNTDSSTKTFTAIVNEIGTYTVTATATDGSGKSKSQSVSITADGQSVSVTLTYKLYLFNNGVVSGIAWDKESKDGDTTKASSSVSNTISLSASGYWADIFYDSYVTRGTSDSHDLSAYTTLKLNVSAISNYGKSKIYIGTTALGKDIHTSDINRNTGVVSIDLSAINGSYFISLHNSSVSGDTGTSTISVDKIWLE